VALENEIRMAPARLIRGRVRVPGDKSISHRYAILAALAAGRSSIAGFAPGADCRATLACLAQLGVEIAVKPRAEADQGPEVEVLGRGVRGLQPPAGCLDAQNSGTTLRLLAGVLAAHRFESILTGDASLRRRPMCRVVAPLEQMGARITSDEGRAPLTIAGADLHGISHVPEVPSAQVKSAVLLAGLQAAGTTSVAEPARTRNHTEIALAAFGAEVQVSGTTVSIAGGQRLRGRRLRVPGDISSAAFWAAAAAALPGSVVELVDVGLNPTRTAFLDVLRRAGATVAIELGPADAGEPWGQVQVSHGELRPVTVGADEVPALIDELPVLAALATHGGEIRVTGASELRVKESDRITALVAGLRALGADAEELPDGFHVRATRRLSGGTADAAGDHRLAMAFAIGALGAANPSIIAGARSVEISYPQFFDVLRSVAR
jgi:3-phosphoshikimate 1-carboxyvinyltransferase